MLIEIKDLCALVLMSAGLAFVVTCTKAGYPIRLLWAAIFRHRWFRWTWNLVMCPHCNSWWSGGIVSLLLGYPWYQALQVAFTACGSVFILQRALQRDLGFSVKPPSPGSRWWKGSLLGVSLEPDEDFEEILGLEEEDGDES